MKLKQIGERCGGMDYAAVSQAQHRMENKLRQERSARRGPETHRQTAHRC